MHRQVLVERAKVAHVGQVEPGGQRLAVIQGLAKQHARVQEQDRQVRLHLGDHVQQHRRFRPEGRDHGQPVGVEVDRRLDDGLRIGVAQTRIQRPHVQAFVQGPESHGRHPASPRSTNAGSR